MLKVQPKCGEKCSNFIKHGENAQIPYKFDRNMLRFHPICGDKAQISSNMVKNAQIPSKVR